MTATINPVKQKLAAGQAVWGVASGVADEWANQMTLTSRPDFIWIDTEHSTFGLEAVRLIPILARQAGVMPLVRVAGLDANLIKRAMDLGSSGIMVPQVNNAAEAEAAVKACMYAPMGNRGVSPLWTFYSNLPWSEYLPQANDEACVVVQVETAEGMRNVEEIAAVPGVDVVFAGPSDLSAAMGVIGQTEHPEVRRFLEEFPKRVRSVGKVAGISVGGAERAIECYEQGYRFVNVGSLIIAGVRGLTADLERVRTYAESA